MSINLPQVDKFNQEIKKIVDQVENPQYQGARETFGYKKTEEEKKKVIFWLDFLEKTWWLIAVLVVVIILILNWSKIKSFFDFITAPKEEITIEEHKIVDSQIINSIFEGKTFQATVEAQLLRPEFFEEINYYNAGDLKNGEYQGAKRLIAVAKPNQAKENWVFEFLQLTDGTILLNGGKDNSTLWLRNILAYYLGQMINQDKVQFVDQLPNDFPQNLQLNGTMMLYRRDYLTEMGPYDGVNAGSARLKLILNSNDYKALPPLGAQFYKDLNFYSKTYNLEEMLAQIAPNLPPKDDTITDRFVEGGTKVVVTDSTGVAMVYELTFLSQWEDYQRFILNRELLNIEIYKQELIKYTSTQEFAEYRSKILNFQTATLPQNMPLMPGIENKLPGFKFDSSAFEFKEQKPLFMNFNSGYTSSCSSLIDGKVVKNLTMDGLEPIGKIFIPQATLYKLKDDEHPLNHLAYELKFLSQNLGANKFLEENLELILQIKDYKRNDADRIRQGLMAAEMPNREEYVSKIPLLFFTDAWGRIVMIWENDIIFLEECVIIDDNNS